MTDAPVLTGRARLEAARAAAADLAARKAQAESTVEQVAEPRPIKIVEPGTTVHVLRGGVTVNLGGNLPSSTVVLERGRTFTVTAEMIALTKNRNGELGGVALAVDEDEQQRRWGEVRFRVGAAPDDMRPWIHGDADWSDARERARRAAHAQPTEDLRAEALAEVHRVYGAAPVTSYSLNSAPNASIREAEMQQDRLAGRGEL